MSRLEIVWGSEASGDRCQDRHIVLQADERTVIAVVDGAGGMGDGEAAAQAVVDEIKNGLAKVGTADQWAELLKETDSRVVLDKRLRSLSRFVPMELQVRASATAKLG